jgi:hypothetical protein
MKRMDDRDELEEALELLRYTFEELKELRNWSLHEFLGARSGEPDRIQNIIWNIGTFLGEF